MKTRQFSAVVVALLPGILLAQTGQPPKTLPGSITGQSHEKPADPAKAREAAIKGLQEDLVQFDPRSAELRKVDGRWQVWASKTKLKDFGSDQTAAAEAVGVIRDLRFNQHGTVTGARPEFDYWLIDGKAPSPVGIITIVPISPSMIRAEQIGGAWVVTDGVKGLHDFGEDEESARRAAAVYWKYGFNRLGVIGGFRPAMMYPLTDKSQSNRVNNSSPPYQSAAQVISDLTRTSLLLPGNVLAGPKIQIDVIKLEVVRKDATWLLMADKETLGRFGTSEYTARHAMKALQDAKVTEVAKLGESGLPLFLFNGKAVSSTPLGANRKLIRPDRLKVQKLRDSWWLVEDSRPLTDAGSKNDAELLLHAIRTFDLKSLAEFGRLESGGMPFFTTGP